MQHRKEALMIDKCTFKQAGRCDIWIDYQVSLAALEDAKELADENWKEISYLLDRVYQLEQYIKSFGIDIPPAL